MSLQELEAAVKGLAPADLSAFERWFEEYLAEAWDRRIEEDIQAGKWDDAGRRAIDDLKTGSSTPL